MSDKKNMLKTIIELAYEAGKWEGQVELEEHYDNEQYSKSMIEVFHSLKTAMPLENSSNHARITIHLRSQKWRDGVRKSGVEYKNKITEMFLNCI